MATPDTQLTIELATLLKGLQPTLKGLGQLEKSLKNIATIKLGTGKTFSASNFDKATVSAQRLLLKQQLLSVQTQELANRQERARQATERLTLSQQRLAKSAQRANSTLGQADAHVRFFKAIQQAAVSADKHVQFFRNNERLLAKAPQMDAHVRAFRAIQKGVDQADAHVKFFRANEAALAKAPQLDAHVQAFRKLEAESKRASDAQIADAKRAAKQITETQRKLISSLQSFGRGLKSLGQSLTIGLTVPLTALGILATKNAVTLDSLKRGLTAITGSAEDAAVQLVRLREIAKAPGIGFQEAIQGSIRLQAVGFSAKEAERALIQFANAVALTGGGREELERVTVQLGQLAAKGKVVAQDLKPIIEAAPAVGQALLKAFGTVNSEDIQKLGLSTDQFLDKLLTALADLPKAAAGAKNAFENFSDSVFVASSAIGEAILPPLTRIINTLEPIILDLAEKFRALSPEIQTVVIAVGALAAAAGPVLFALGSIITSLGMLITGITAVAGLIGAIGFPELLLVLGALAIQITALAAGAIALFKAWQTNFLGIRDIVARASQTVLKAFRDIRAVFNEATQRILPTLQSITSKIVNAITAVWNQYGERIVKIVGESFKFVLDVTTTFLREFGNFVDLVLKLIDGDWQGAWRAFSRFVITAIDSLERILSRLNRIVANALRAVISFLLTQAARFILAAEELGTKFITALSAEIIAGSPKIRDALADMLLLAAAGVFVGPIAGVLVARLLAAMRKAAAEGEPLPGEPGGPTVGVDVGAGAGLFRHKKPARKGAGSGKDDKKARDLLDKLKQAQDDFAAAQADAQLALTRSAVEQQFQLTKDGLDRELQLLNANFDDRLVAVKKFFAERQRIEEAEIDAELTHEKALSAALFEEWSNRRKQIEREFQTAIQDIDRDPKLSGRAKALARQTAEQKRQTELTKAQSDLETQNADISTRILQLQKQRADIGAVIAREAKNLTEELQRQRDQLTFDLLEEQGATADAAALRLKAQFKDTLKELRVDVQSLSPELQKALNDVDLTVLRSKLEQLPEPVKILLDLLDIGIAKARIAERAVDVDRSLAELRLQESAIQNKVLDGVLTEKQAREQIVGLQQISRGRLLDILAAQLKIAEATAGQEDEVLRIREQIQEIERLGKIADRVGQDINRALFEDIGSGIEGILNSARKGIDGLKDAAISFGESLLSTLNRIATQGLLQKLEGVFKPDAEDTKGTPGGFLAKLFGLAPKATEPTALTTAATAAGTALTTGATAASTALTTGGATASATWLTGVTAAATSFTAAVVAAGAAFAASVAAASATQGFGGLGGALGGEQAATGMFPAVPGGMVRIVEGNYPEAVLTTDPKHAARQVQILKAYLQKTKGLFGRFKMPEFAEGGFISARDAETNLLSSIQRSPPMFSTVPDAELATAGGSPVSVRVINQLTSKTATRPYLTSEEGVKDILNIISANSSEIGRRIGVK